MSYAAVTTRSVVGLDAKPVTVEVHLSGGLPAMNIVGLPDTAVKEARDRVRSAIINSDYEFPARRITINLSPADLPKDGAHYDLPIAIGVLVASGQIPNDRLINCELAGELSLEGQIREINAALPLMIAAQKPLICPKANLAEASIVNNKTIYGVNTLRQVCAWLSGINELTENTGNSEEVTLPAATPLESIAGQEAAKRALMVAASGRHNILLIGPPGCGKSLLASALPSLLPALTDEQAIESASIQSICGYGVNAKNYRYPAFRKPHHSASSVALVGGGSQVKPGEISLAHNGVLFLDEFPEFDRRVLEVLREPLETREICISRAARQATYPANFQLIAAMNPAPTGIDMDGSTASISAAQRYRQKISAPLLDRIDQLISVPKVELKAMVNDSGKSERLTTATAKEIITTARNIQLQRQGKLNAELSAAETDKYAVVSDVDKEWLVTAVEKLGLSARGYHRVLRLARTIADLANVGDIERIHLQEALGYRRLERTFYK